MVSDPRKTLIDIDLSVFRFISRLGGRGCTWARSGGTRRVPPPRSPTARSARGCSSTACRATPIRPPRSPGTRGTTRSGAARRPSGRAGTAATSSPRCWSSTAASPSPARIMGPSSRVPCPIRPLAGIMWPGITPWVSDVRFPNSFNRIFYKSYFWEMAQIKYTQHSASECVLQQIIGHSYQYI